jgi:hypothetical protein
MKQNYLSKVVAPLFLWKEGATAFPISPLCLDKFEFFSLVSSFLGGCLVSVSATMKYHLVTKSAVQSERQSGILRQNPNIYFLNRGWVRKDTKVLDFFFIF